MKTLEILGGLYAADLVQRKMEGVVSLFGLSVNNAED